MRILLVDAYEENKKGNQEFNMFHKIFVGLLRRADAIADDGIHDVTVRRINCLSDIVLDWEREPLPPEAEDLSKEFDKYDLVCVSGDMKFLPWEPFFFQTITLIHMCHLMGKPIITCGGGAFAAVYACATQGAKFYILNGATGGPVEGLKDFPVYAAGTKAYPCGYLDNETGDIYSYDPASRYWAGVCNTGMYRSAASGRPSSSRFRPPQKKFTGLNRKADNHRTYNDRETVIVIRNQSLHHFALRNCSSSSFTASATPNWFLNVEGGMPLQSGLEILAEGPNGPAIVGMDRALHITVMVDESYSSEVTRDILFHYLKHIVNSIADRGNGRSLYKFLFGGKAGITEKHRLSTSYARSLCQIPTRSKVAGGPEKVDLPLPSSFEVRVRTQEEMTAQLQAILHSTRLNVKKDPERVVCNPRHQNKTRLLQVIGKYSNNPNKMTELISDDKALQQSSDKNVECNNTALQTETSPGKYGGQLYFGHSPRPPPRHDDTAQKLAEEAAEPAPDIRRPHTAMSHPEKNRLNWEKNWVNVRTYNQYEKRQYCDDEGVRKETKTQISRKNSLHYLPKRHPRESAKCVNKTVKLPNPSSKPYNSYSKYEDMDVEEVESYEGQYQGGFLTPYERERKEYINAKEKFLAGEFRCYFGVASAIPLRKEGGVRGHGSYPADIKYHKDKVRNKPFLPVKNLYKTSKQVSRLPSKEDLSVNPSKHSR